MLTDYYSQETCIEIFDYLRRTGQVDTAMPDKDTGSDKDRLAICLNMQKHG